MRREEVWVGDKPLEDWCSWEAAGWTSLDVFDRDRSRQAGPVLVGTQDDLEEKMWQEGVKAGESKSKRAMNSEGSKVPREDVQTDAHREFKVGYGFKDRDSTVGWRCRAWVERKRNMGRWCSRGREWRKSRGEEESLILPFTALVLLVVVVVVVAGWTTVNDGRLPYEIMLEWQQAHLDLSLDTSANLARSIPRHIAR
jgi:hypothetical protein